MADRTTPDLAERPFLLALLGLVAAALLLRLWGIDLTAYNIDETNLSLGANQIANFKAFTLVGVETSLGFHNPPLFIYLMSPAFLATPLPHLAMVLLAMAGAGAAGLNGLTAGRLGGRWAGLVAGALTAFSPNAIDHSRRLWGHDTIIFWGALCLYGAVRGIQSRQERWLWVSVAAAACAQACHLSGALLWIVPAGALALWRPPRAARTVAFAAAVLALVYLPWFAQAVGDDFADLRALATALSGDAPSAALPDVVPPSLAWLALLADSLHDDNLSEHYGAFASGDGAGRLLVRGGAVASGILVLGAVAWLATVAWRGGGGDRRRWALVLLLTLLAPLVAFGLAPVQTVPPYQLPAFCAAAVGAALALAWLGDWVSRRRAGRVPWTPVMAMGAVVLAAALGTARHGRALEAISDPAPGDHVAATLRAKLDALTHIAADGSRVEYAIMQDGRPGPALDRWVLYLHYCVTSQATVPNNPASPRTYVILDERVRLRPEVRAFLDTRRGERFGVLRVYGLQGDTARAWRELVRRYPPPRQPDTMADGIHRARTPQRS